MGCKVPPAKPALSAVLRFDESEAFMGGSEVVVSEVSPS